jgi:hypothetical protein
MSRVISHSLEIIKESIVEHVSTIFAVRDCLVSEIALHLDDPQDLLVLDFLKFFF